MDNYKPTATSGFETNAISEFAENNFEDVLMTGFSDEVLLYDNTLLHCKKINCVIQGNSADTYLKSMERVGLFPIGTVKAGMYIYFDNRYWLITGYPSNNKVYEKAVMLLCQFKIRWQDSFGNILERWAYATSASKYDDGEKEGESVTLSSDNLTVMLPNDNDTLGLYGKRVFIDKREVPFKVYKFTRSDDVLYDYGDSHGAVLAFIADKNELNEDTDRPDLRICDYMPPTPTPIPPDDDPSTIDDDIMGEIVGNKTMKVGFERVYTAKLLNRNGNVVDWSDSFSWDISGDINVIYFANGEKIRLLVDDEEYSGKSFTLIIKNNNTTISQLEITVTEFI